MRRKWLALLIVAIVLIWLLIVAALSQRQPQQIFITPTPTPTTTSTPTPTTSTNIITVSSPGPNQVISSPLTITGQARGNWFFEATAPVRLLDGNDRQIAVGFITAQGEWMTTNFVPFSGQLTFAPPNTNTGTLVLEKNNPSGLPQNDQSITIPVRFR